MEHVANRGQKSEKSCEIQKNDKKYWF